MSKLADLEREVVELRQQLAAVSEELRGRIDALQQRLEKLPEEIGATALAQQYQGELARQRSTR